MFFLIVTVLTLVSLNALASIPTTLYTLPERSVYVSGMSAFVAFLSAGASYSTSGALAFASVTLKPVLLPFASTSSVPTGAGVPLAESSAALASSSAFFLASSSAFLASAFAASQASLTSASDNLVASYQNIASSISSASNGSQNFAQQMDGITKNISTINSVFELQVRTVNEQNEAMKSLAGAVNKIQSSLENSAQSAADYQQQISNLANNLKQLNNVYGGMLNAMTIR